MSLRFNIWCSGWAPLFLTGPVLRLWTWSATEFFFLLTLSRLLLTNVSFCPGCFQIFFQYLCGDCLNLLKSYLQTNITWTKGDFEHTVFRSQFRKLGMFVALLLFCIGFLIAPALNDPGICSTRGEGFVVIMHYEGVDSTSLTKDHEQELQRVFEPYHTKHTCRQVAKRSFRRACKRASQHGYTGYRGCLVSAAHLGVQHAPVLTPIKLPQNLKGHRHRLRQRLTCFCWNAGGLSSDTWDAFQVWL